MFSFVFDLSDKNIFNILIKEPLPTFLTFKLSLLSNMCALMCDGCPDFIFNHPINSKYKTQDLIYRTEWKLHANRKSSYQDQDSLL